MSRGTEPEDADRLARSCGHQRTPADQTGAEEGCQRDGIVVLGQTKRISFVGDRMGREAAVPRVSREQRFVAQVLLSGDAVRAMSAGMAEPWNADALAQCAAADSRTERVHPS